MHSLESRACVLKQSLGAAETALLRCLQRLASSGFAAVETG